MHMLPKTDESESQLRKYLSWKDKEEVKPIPKDDKNPEKAKDDAPDWKDKKNDDYNEYEYSDEKETDDTKW